MLRTTTAVLSLLVSVASCRYVPSTPTVQVKNGTYVGVHSADYNQDYFLGLPYAQPPVGNLRFRNPVSLNQSWSGTKPVATYSAECYGYGSDQWNYPISEDCLYINVVRPADCEHEKLPVVFWIHGGGFNQGGGVDQRYNGSFMVQNSVSIGKPIIFTSINYRLSAWGFLSGNEEVRKSGNMNLGLRDQRLALQWIQENIGAFGGNPDKVTIAGESAGAVSVGLHLTAYSGRDDNLFRAAIMESGNPVHYGPLLDPLGYASQYNELIRRSGCAAQASPLECLRALPVAQLNTAINTTSPNATIGVTNFNPIVDGDFVQRKTSLQLAAGDFVHVPIIDGANADEGSSFSPVGVNTTQDFYNALTSTRRGNVTANLANEVLIAYPDNPAVNVVANLGLQRPGLPYGAQFRRSASYYGDATFIAPRRLTCQTWAAANVSAYCYRFNAIPAGIPYSIGATHFQEVAFVFHNLQGVGYAPAAVPPFTNKTESYRTLSKFMSSNWVSFIHDLDPNAWRETYDWTGMEERWPVYELDNPKNIVFDANVTSYAEPDTYRKEGMELINAHNVDVYMR